MLVNKPTKRVYNNITIIDTESYDLSFTDYTMNFYNSVESINVGLKDIINEYLFMNHKINTDETEEKKTKVIHNTFFVGNEINLKAPFFTNIYILADFYNLFKVAPISNLLGEYNNEQSIYICEKLKEIFYHTLSLIYTTQINPSENVRFYNLSSFILFKYIEVVNYIITVNDNKYNVLNDTLTDTKKTCTEVINKINTLIL